MISLSPYGGGRLNRSQKAYGRRVPRFRANGRKSNIPMLAIRRYRKLISFSLPPSRNQPRTWIHSHSHTLGDQSSFQPITCSEIKYAIPPPATKAIYPTRANCLLLGAILSDGCPRFEYSVAKFITTTTSVIANGGMRVTGRISRHHGELSIQYIPHRMPNPLVKSNPCPAAVVSVGTSGMRA